MLEAVRSIKCTLVEASTGGYFYEDNCRVNYSSIKGWYTKRSERGKITLTTNITEKKAEELITESLRNERSI